jgi:hypothetical protein
MGASRLVPEGVLLDPVPRQEWLELEKLQRSMSKRLAAVRRRCEKQLPRNE